MDPRVVFRFLGGLVLIIGVTGAENDSDVGVATGRRLNFNPFTNFNNFNNFNNLNNNLNNNNWISPQQARYADCTTQLGAGGLCMRSKECGRSGGIPSGFCSGLNVCCLVALQCGGASSAKKILINNNVATTTTGSSTCAYTINRFSPYVCQLRVDFSTNMPMPTSTSTDGTLMPSCTGTYLQINNIQFCGVNNNQHVYVPFAPPTSSYQITAAVSSTATGGSVNANWQVTITQLECPPSNSTSLYTSANLYDNTNLNTNLFTTQYPGQILDFRKLLKKRNFDTDLIAPNGCLQYFPAPSGTFESFNYNGGLGPYMPNMQYAICFNRLPTSTGIQFYGQTFSMSYNEGLQYDDDCFDPITPSASNDFLFIPYSTITQTMIPATRYCGKILDKQNLVANPPGPFVVLVNTGLRYRSDAANPTTERAFRIDYSVIG